MTAPVTARQAEALRKQLAFLTRDGDRYRVVITDSESCDGITLVCTSPQHVENDTRPEASAPPPEDGTGVSVYDCCLQDFRPIETNSETFAAFAVAALDVMPALLNERDKHAKLLGIGVDREQWDAISEAEGCRYEYEQTGDTIVGYLAYRYEDMKAQRHVLLRQIEELERERDEARMQLTGAQARLDYLEGRGANIPSYLPKETT